MGGHGGLNILPQVTVLLGRPICYCLGRMDRLGPAVWPAKTDCRPCLHALQKRWNVYGRENRLKVARDEAKYEEEQAAVRERAEQADRERRRQLLLERARHRYGVREYQLYRPREIVTGWGCNAGPTALLGIRGCDVPTVGHREHRMVPSKTCSCCCQAACQGACAVQVCVCVAMRVRCPTGCRISKACRHLEHPQAL